MKANHWSKALGWLMLCLMLLVGTGAEAQKGKKGNKKKESEATIIVKEKEKIQYHFEELKADDFEPELSFTFTDEGVGVVLIGVEDMSTTTIKAGSKVLIKCAESAMREKGDDGPMTKAEAGGLAQLVTDGDKELKNELDTFTITIGQDGPIPMAVNRALMDYREGSHLRVFVPSPLAYKSKSTEHGLEEDDILEMYIIVKKVE